ncbi:hypothetical protein AVEN_263537-1 [Araneus ventricosus]|uniref:Uncharacterized protein n=1 Tax=Araneus ventricosus TaxID=182803 RepID=A0A4Y2QT04_ARAVE|nr:hypothetical protein AVEN_263537-1 [Araneus ventricosus]
MTVMNLLLTSRKSLLLPECKPAQELQARVVSIQAVSALSKCSIAEDHFEHCIVAKENCPLSSIPFLSGSQQFADLQKPCLWPNLTEEKLHKAEKRMKRERIHQMLQIIWMHIDCRYHLCTETASDALRLIWCSVPDACISFKEINRVFRGISELKN